MVSLRTMNDTVSVIIVAWNAGRFLEPCLSAVFAQRNVPCEVIIVDNGSRDETSAVLDRYQSRLILIRNAENRGFCTANNQGIERATGSLILTLNSDVVLEPDYVLMLSQFLRSRPDIAMVQGKLLRMDGKTIDSAGLALSATKRLFDIGSGKEDGSRFSRPREIFGPCAAAALYRRDMLDRVRQSSGYFDERFFYLVEDFDLAWRLRKAGARAWYVPQARARHFRQSAPHNSAFKQYLSWRNRYYLILKHAGIRGLWALGPALLWYDLPRLVYFLGKNPYAPQAIREVNQCLRRRGSWQGERPYARV